jgi:hypothetical protein
MHIVSFADNLAHAAVDLLVVGLHTGDFAKTDAFKQLDRGLDGLLGTEVRAHNFTAKPMQTLCVVNRSTALKACRVTLVGLGPRRARSTQNACEGLLRLAGTATRLANAVGAKEVLLSLPHLPQGCSPRAMQGLVALLARGAHLGGYRYTAYRSTAGRPASLKKMHLHLPEGAAAAPAAQRAALEQGRIVAEATALVRDLVNESPSDLHPQSFAQKAAALAAEHGLKCTIWDPARLQKAEMNLLLAVGRGSERPPRLVHLIYTPKKLGGKKASKQPAAPEPQGPRRHVWDEDGHGRRRGGFGRGDCRSTATAAGSRACRFGHGREHAVWPGHSPGRCFCLGGRDQRGDQQHRCGGPFGAGRCPALCAEAEALLHCRLGHPHGRLHGGPGAYHHRPIQQQHGAG